MGDCRGAEFIRNTFTHSHTELYSSRLYRTYTMHISFMFICYPAAGPTVHQDRLFRAYFPIFSTVCLELAVKQTVLISDSLSIFKPRLKTFFSSLMFSLNTVRPAASASEV